MAETPRILSISLPPEMTQAVRKRAEEERRSISEVAREALRRYLSGGDAIADAISQSADSKSRKGMLRQIGHRTGSKGD